MAKQKEVQEQAKADERAISEAKQLADRIFPIYFGQKFSDKFLALQRLKKLVKTNPDAVYKAFESMRTLIPDSKSARIGQPPMAEIKKAVHDLFSSAFDSFDTAAAWKVNQFIHANPKAVLDAMKESEVLKSEERDFAIHNAIYRFASEEPGSAEWKKAALELQKWLETEPIAVSKVIGRMQALAKEGEFAKETARLARKYKKAFRGFNEE
jgi:hypothetical protein